MYLYCHHLSLLCVSGCGTGNYVVAVSPYVRKVTGVEFNSGMLEQARKKVAGLKNVELRQGDATQLDLPDGFCDAVIINQVLYRPLVSLCTIHTTINIYCVYVQRTRE